MLLSPGFWRGGPPSSWLLGPLVAAVVAVWCGPVLAQRDLRDIPPPDPEIERASFELPDGAEVNLFAADPAIAKPIQINFDARGRLWLASSEVYPQIQPGQQANDKILVLEDADGDGRSDSVQVFADGLLIPTGVEPGDGGAYVANSTQLLYLADTDGDGRADWRRILLSGFGTEDTHHIIHTFRWGFDGCLYFNQSIYIHSHVETPYGVRRLGGGGIWRLRPERLELEVFACGLINPWGLHFDRFGQAFATDGAGGEGINHVFPGAAFPTAVGAARVLHGLNPGSPKYSGIEVLSGRHLPDDWQGQLATCDFRAHRVCRFALADSGSGYVSRELPELIRSSHVAFRPVDVKMGPDGAIYIADWYNPIIQHGEVDFRDPRRDRTHGRIWRVTFKGRPLAPRPRLVDAPTVELLDLLASPEGWTRHFARRTLCERAQDEGPDRIAAAVDHWLSARGDRGDAVSEKLEALWLCQALGHVNEPLLLELLAASDPRVRAAATRVAGDWHPHLARPLDLLAERARDGHPRVRLEAVCALARLASGDAVAAALSVLEQPIDENIDFALWTLCRQTQQAWLAGVVDGSDELGAAPAQLEFALRAVDTADTVRPLLRLAASGALPAEREATAMQQVARLGSAADLSMVLDAALRGDCPPRRRGALLDALASAAQSRRARPAGDLIRLTSLLASDEAALAAAAARLLGLWKVTAAGSRLAGMAADEGLAVAVRQGAIEGLAALGGADSGEVLASLAGHGRPVDVRMAAIAGLVDVDAQAAARHAVALLSAAHGSADAARIVNAFLRRQGGVGPLISALADRRLPPDVALVAARAASATARPEAALVEALRTAGGLGAQREPLAADEIERLVTEVVQRGDGARGEQVYRRKENNCLKCHAIGGAGGRVGPDLSSLGASAQIDYLIESILEPSKKIKENYHSLVVLTDEGLIHSGVVVRQTDRDLLLRNAEDEEIAIPLASIEQRQEGASLMPAGLADNLTRDELVDLVRFLSELGKAGAYQVGSARVVRRWLALEPTAEAIERLRRTRIGEAAADDPVFRWEPVYSTVGGLLPLDDLPVIESRRNQFMNVPPLSVARFEIDVASGGAVELLLGEARGLTMWLDEQPLEAADRVRLELPAGRHRITLAIDRVARSAPVRVELADVRGSSAQASLVSGK